MTEPKAPKLNALQEFNIPFEGQKVEDKIANEGAVLEGVDSSAGKSYGNDPEAFEKIATGIGTLAKKAQGIAPEKPEAFNAESGATETVIHDPATLIAATVTVTRISAGGGIDTIGPVDQEYKPNYEGPAWNNRLT